MSNLNIGAILKSGRIQKGLSQTTLAQQLGVNSSSISRWEKNQQIIAGDTLIHAANILGITKQLFPQLDCVDNELKKNSLAYLEKKIAEIEEKVQIPSKSKKLQIIIVEKNYDTLLIIQDAILKFQEKYHIITATYQDMLSILLKNCIDTSLIVIDTDGEKGKNTWQNILKYKHLTKIPKIFITSENLVIPNNCGLVGYIKKPFVADEFFDITKKINLHWPLYE